MRVFHCDHCRQLVFFENTECVRCKRRLAYLPDLQLIGSLESEGEGDAAAWKSPLPQAVGRRYRLCDNYLREDVCNWAVPLADPQRLCCSCRLTRLIPDMSKAGRKEAWYRMELAKRRLVYSLMSLQLPVINKEEDPERGLAFEFVVDPETPDGPPALTGHASGVIRINLAEADDVERERRRCALHEPCRTLLGHFRHEIGHYYWDLMVRDNGGRLEAFRQLFGDERQDYSAALDKNYTQGPPADWQQHYISSYASSHPWEDWAETWAHYLHLMDALETAAVSGLSLRPKRADEPSLVRARNVMQTVVPFDDVIHDWFALTYMLNNFNRGLGQLDAYPFVVSPPAIEKLRFLDALVRVNRPADHPRQAGDGIG